MVVVMGVMAVVEAEVHLLPLVNHRIMYPTNVTINSIASSNLPSLALTFSTCSPNCPILEFDKGTDIPINSTPSTLALSSSQLFVDVQSFEPLPKVKMSFTNATSTAPPTQKTHSVVTPSQTGNLKPKVYLAATYEPANPTCFTQDNKSPH
ncbi:hypothetical protein GH714_026270 [Hevea brasiliensis]|uniref:Uncharacterized protein n=1 Tax=Hevea brasiliensis TaxID=3981 RepID=A0A6A6M6R5_HEVBR|nr:hypothetical protein GH714_026270 [Hevea brasiliensis]